MHDAKGYERAIDMIPAQAPAYLRKADAAKYLSVSLRTISHWKKRGLLAFSKPVPKVCLFAVSDLEKAMRRFRTEAAFEV